jgi:hypothetical protein
LAKLAIRGRIAAQRTYHRLKLPFGAATGSAFLKALFRVTLSRIEPR